MSVPGLQVRVLGPVSVSRGAALVPLPRSRKVRALLGFLSLSPSAVSRFRLCGLLWDVPNDPRGELRWSLSKLRGVLDDPDRRRVITSEGNLIALDLSDCVVDAIEVDRIGRARIESATNESLADLCDRYGGDLLEGLQIDGNPEFTGWLVAQRQRYRELHVAALRELVARSPAGSNERFRRLEAWLQVSPFDQRPHQVMLEALARCGRIRDAEHHVAATIRSFEQEGLDWAPVRDAWQAIRRAPAEAPRGTAGSAPAIVASADLVASDLAAPDLAAPMEGRRHRRGSVAVMPFVLMPFVLMPFVDAEPGPAGRVADGLTEDIITRLAKLRVLFVIARGTVYALRERGIGAEEAGRILNVEYVVSGSVRRQNSRTSVVVELVETEGARIVWTDEIEGGADDTFSMLDAIVDRIVAAIAEEIEAEECNRAILKPPSSLDAWEAYHRGLWHMYRFNDKDNRDAELLFQSAIRLDPTFARAYAGLSFTHFQNAFLDLTPDRERQIELAFDTAGHSIGADDRDPAAHWAMGRALWLRGVQSESFAELGRSIELSPNFALGHYTLGFVHSQTGDPRTAIAATNHSRALSPFDPLQFAMLASRALAHLRLGELEEAVDWAVKATGRPNAHAHILAIAAECLALVNRRDEARKFVARIRQRLPGYGIEHFLRAFRFDGDTQRLFRSSARQIDFDSTPGPGAAGGGV
jgi:DNA-binding SARP family transcriptional activator/TolB-like protein